MKAQLIAGSIVAVRVAGGGVADLVVTEDRGDVVLMCNEKEYQDALAEGRKPVAIGFRRAAIQDATRKPMGAIANKRTPAASATGD